MQLSILARESGRCRNESSPVPLGPRVGGEQDRCGPRLKEHTDLGESWDHNLCTPPPPRAALPPLRLSTHPTSGMRLQGGLCVGSCSLLSADLGRARTWPCLSVYIRLFPPALRLGCPSCFRRACPFSSDHVLRVVSPQEALSQDQVLSFPSI